ncbi:MAG: SpoIIIAH-like family protein [Clostridiales bacterium]
MKKKKISLSKKWLVVLMGLCLAFLLYDMAENNNWQGNSILPALSSGMSSDNIGLLTEDGNKPGKDEFSKEEDSKEIGKEEQDQKKALLESASATEDPALSEKNVFDAAAKQTFIGDYRQERENIRSQEVEMLKAISEDKNSLEEIKLKAQNRQIAVAKNMEEELLIETLLESKKFPDTIAFVQEGKVTIVLNQAIDAKQAGQIADIVDGTTGIGFENVVMIQNKQQK